VNIDSANFIKTQPDQFSLSKTFKIKPSEHTMFSRATVVASRSWTKSYRTFEIHNQALLGVRGFGTAPPPSVPPKSPYNIEPSTVDKSKEEMRLHTRSYNESNYKLGKHRSNALELIEKVPIIYVDGERAICDGGGGPLGHPLEYISLQRPGVIERCKYCGLRFGSKSWAAEH
jgi:NADH dehydrogenase (ubiquinone) Fe-S protein 6